MLGGIVARQLVVEFVTKCMTNTCQFRSKGGSGYRGCFWLSLTGLSTNVQDIWLCLVRFTRLACRRRIQTAGQDSVLCTTFQMLCYITNISTS